MRGLWLELVKLKINMLAIHSRILGLLGVGWCFWVTDACIVISTKTWYGRRTVEVIQFKTYFHAEKLIPYQGK